MMTIRSTVFIIQIGLTINDRFYNHHINQIELFINIRVGEMAEMWIAFASVTHRFSHKHFDNAFRSMISIRWLIN